MLGAVVLIFALVGSSYGHCIAPDNYGCSKCLRIKGCGWEDTTKDHDYAQTTGRCVVASGVKDVIRHVDDCTSYYGDMTSQTLDQWVENNENYVSRLMERLVLKSDDKILFAGSHRLNENQLVKAESQLRSDAEASLLEFFIVLHRLQFGDNSEYEESLVSSFINGLDLPEKEVLEGMRPEVRELLRIVNHLINSPARKQIASIIGGYFRSDLWQVVLTKANDAYEATHYGLCRMEDEPFDVSFRWKVSLTINAADLGKPPFVAFAPLSMEIHHGKYLDVMNNVLGKLQNHPNFGWDSRTNPPNQYGRIVFGNMQGATISDHKWFDDDGDWHRGNNDDDETPVKWDYSAIPSEADGTCQGTKCVDSDDDNVLLQNTKGK